MNKKIVLLFAIAGAAAGCASPSIRLRGLRPMNLNEIGESTPVDVRIYQLADNRKFLESEFNDLWLRDGEILGEDLLGKPRVVTILPGDVAGGSEVVLDDVSKSAKFIGLMALFPRTEPGRVRRMAIRVSECSRAAVDFQGFGLSLTDENRAAALDGSVPVEVHIYQLKDDKKFLEAGFDDIWMSGASVLKESACASPAPRTVYPGNPQEPAPTVKGGELDVTAVYLAVISRYVRDGSEQKYRRVVRLGQRNQYTFDIGGGSVTVEVDRAQRQ